MTYHPVTLSKCGPEEAIQALFDALDAFPDGGIIFTQANSDTDGRRINSIIQEYVGQHTDRMLCVKTLGQVRYLSAVRFMDAVIGNSSSGILEVPSFRVPTVNLGVRQRGRLMAPSVIENLTREFISLADKAGAIYKAKIITNLQQNSPAFVLHNHPFFSF